MKQLIKIIALQFILAMIWLSLIRLVFFILYYDLFYNAAFLDIVSAFFIGLRFDISVICFYFGLLNLLYFIPFFHLYKNRYYIILHCCLGASIFFLLFSVQTIDLGYYATIGRRLSFELFYLSADAKAMFRLLIKEYSVFLVLYVFTAIFLFFIWFKLAQLSIKQCRETQKITPIKYISVFFCYLILIIIGGRGGLQNKPLLEADAFKLKQLTLGHLALNAPFTFSKQLILNPIKPYRFIDEKTAHDHLQSLLSTDEEKRFINEDYPFLTERLQQGSRNKKTNVVLIIIESFSSQFIDEKTTPYFSKLKDQGLYFSNFHASGSRSIEGIASILLSLPAYPDFTYLESALQQNKNASIATILKAQGYHSYFINGSFYGSFGMHQLAEKNGFDTILSQEDFHNYKAKSDSVWGIWDQYQYERLTELLNKNDAPFFATLLTLSSHEPYELPDQKFALFDKNEKHYRHKNLLHYADWSLGQFIESSRKMSWFENTLFIITADHAYLGESHLSKSQIPLLLYTADKRVQRGINAQLGSQVDIMPTIIDFLDLESQFAATGKSLLAQSDTHFAYYSSGRVTWYFDEHAFIFDKELLLSVYHYKDDPTFSKPLDKNTIKNFEDIKNAFLSWYQTSHNAVINNQIIP